MTRSPHRCRVANAALAASILFAAFLLALAPSSPARDRLYIGATPGPRLLRVDLADGTREVASGVVATGVVSMSRLPGRGWTLFASDVEQEFFRADDASGATRPIGAPTFGGGAPLVAAERLCGTPEGRVFATGYSPELGGVVLEIDPDSGARTIVSAYFRGAGPLGYFREIVAESPTSLLVSTAESLEKILRVDIATGDRTLVSGQRPDPPFDNAGAGPLFSDVNGMALSPEGDALYVHGRRVGNSSVDGVDGAISRVDLATGDRTAVSNSNLGGGPRLLRGDGDLVFVGAGLLAATGGSPGSANLLLVDITNGSRRLLSGDGEGAGPDLIEPFQLELTSDGEALLAFDEERLAAYRVDLATGDRTLAISNRVGDGPDFGATPNDRGPRGLADESAGSLLALARWNESSSTLAETKLIRVEKATGDRTIVADNATGTGPELGFGSALIVADGGRVFSFAGGLLEIDPATGDRAFIAGAGPALEDIRSFAVDPGSGDLFALGRNKYYRVDLATGDRTLVIDSGAVGSIFFVRSAVLGADGLIYGVSGLLSASEIVSVDPVAGAIAYPVILPNEVRFASALALGPLGLPVAAFTETFDLWTVEPGYGLRTLARDPWSRTAPVMATLDGMLVADDSQPASPGLAVR
jgi:hypothetical protein